MMSEMDESMDRLQKSIERSETQDDLNELYNKVIEIMKSDMNIKDKLDKVRALIHR
jgi:hypothetical protein